MGRRLLSFALLFFVTVPCIGSAGFPLIKGVISKNGEFVVLVDYDMDNSRSGVSRVKRITYHVQGREHFINFSFGTSNQYWSESAGWKLTIVPSKWAYLPLPVVSDDGNAIALLAINPPFGKETEVIRIYRNKDSSEELVGSYRLQDIWSQEELRKQVVTVAINGRPLWLNGSKFEFSSDSEQFTVHTASGRVVHIDVRNGKINDN